MSKEPKGLDVSIMGREFRVACSENERQALLEAVAYLDKKMREIKDTGKLVGAERIAIMAALNITHELLGTRIKGGFDIGEFKRRMNSMQGMIDQVMSEQDDLF